MSLLYGRGENMLENSFVDEPALGRLGATPRSRARKSEAVAQKNLDKLDMLILDVLQRDVTLPVLDLAERVNSSKSVVWRRIQQMVESGVIRERVAVVHARSVGLNVLVFARVRMVSHNRETLSQFIKAMQDCPEVVECHSLLGDVDFLLKVVAQSLDDYQEFFARKLSRVEGVREVTSSVAVSQVVSTTQLPLRWLASVSAGQSQ